MNCESIEANMNNLQLLFNKMKKLRDEDTSELEKSLKRNTDLESIIRLFDLKLK